MPGCSGRSQRGGRYQVRFHRKPDGEVDPTGGEKEGSSLAERQYRLTVKYDKQVRLLLATAAVILEDGTVEGCRGEAIDYTDRWVCMHSDLELHRQTKWLRVKALLGNGAP